jgi:hypothetical protein
MLEKKVENWLRSDDRTRDNDRLLISFIWWNELPNDLRTDDVKRLLRLFSGGLLSNPESIRRCRQRIQEVETDLRGVSYQSRQKNAGEVRKKALSDKKRIV